MQQGHSVVTWSRLLQEDNQTQGKPLLWISPQRLRKASGGSQSLVCMNTSDAALTDPEHLRGVHASGETWPVGLVCCGMVKRALALCLVLLNHGVLHFYHSTVVPESNPSRSTPPENCLALSSGKAALWIVGYRAGTWRNSAWTFAWTLCSVWYTLGENRSCLPAPAWSSCSLGWIYCPVYTAESDQYLPHPTVSQGGAVAPQPLREGRLI